MTHSQRVVPPIYVIMDASIKYLYQSVHSPIALKHTISLKVVVHGNCFASL